MPVTHPYEKPKNAEFAAATVGAIVLIAGIGVSYAHSKIKLMSRPHVYQENVVAGPEPESYCIVDGQRAYLSIDGATIESKIKNRDE